MGVDFNDMAMGILENPEKPTETATDGGVVTVTIEDLISREFPPREIILAPWLRKQSLDMMHAWRGVGKTHVALEIAYAVATGGSFLKAIRSDARVSSPWCFPSQNPMTHVDAQNFYRRAFLPALAKAGIKDIVWHTLRHTTASRLVMAGVDIRTVQEIMGHKTLAMTMRYSHLSGEHLSRAIGRISEGVIPEVTDTKTDKPENDVEVISS